MINIMPQLDFDLLDDFIYFALLALVFGFGDGEIEENVILSNIDKYLAEYYLNNMKSIAITLRSIDNITTLRF